MTILDIQTIRDLRKQKGWEQRDLAQAAGVNPAVISRLERGLQNDFKLSVIVAIALALDVAVDNLITHQYRIHSYQLDPLLLASVNRLSLSGQNKQKTIASIINAFLDSGTEDEK